MHAGEQVQEEGRQDRKEELGHYDSDDKRRPVWLLQGP